MAGEGYMGRYCASCGSPCVYEDGKWRHVENGYDDHQITGTSETAPQVPEEPVTASHSFGLHNIPENSSVSVEMTSKGHIRTTLRSPGKKPFVHVTKLKPPQGLKLEGVFHAFFSAKEAQDVEDALCGYMRNLKDVVILGSEEYAEDYERIRKLYEEWKDRK